MRRDRDRAVADLGPQFVEPVEEQQVAIHVGDRGRARGVVQHPQGQHGRAREIIFDRRAVLPGLAQTRLELLQFAEGQQLEAGQREPRQRLVALLTETQHPELEIRTMRLQ